MTSIPWDSPASIILQDETEPLLDGLTLARAIQIVMEELPSEQGINARIDFQGGVLEGRAIATIYHSPQFPLRRRKNRKSSGGQITPDKRRHMAA